MNVHLHMRRRYVSLLALSHGSFYVVIFILSQLFPAQVVMETNLLKLHQNQIWSACIMKQAPGRQPCCPIKFTDTKG